MKTCIKCNNLKSIDSFYWRADNNTHRKECKKCFIKATEKRRQFDLQKDKESKRKYYIKNREKALLYCKKWSQENRGLSNALKKKYKMQKKAAMPKWLTSEQITQINQFYKDAEFLTNYTKTKFQVDHIIPIQGKNVCGLHVPWNLQLLTAFENNSKNNKVL